MTEIVLLAVAFVLAAITAVFGFFDALYLDATGIVWVLLALAAVCTAFARHWRALLKWVCDQGVSVTLGLLGTVIGFMSALSGVAEGDTAAKLAGVETALVTTITGIIVHLWLLVVREITRAR